MQAAARQRGQAIGHYLIAHAGRTPWDIKTKATSETARGVRMWMNFCYGPSLGQPRRRPAVAVAPVARQARTVDRQRRDHARDRGRRGLAADRPARAR